MKSKKGFTLIELLVVIAVISLLSSIILASLSSARNKGADSNIKSNLGTVKTQAALFYANNGENYGNGFPFSALSCQDYDLIDPNSMFRDQNIAAAIAAAKNVNGDTGYNSAKCIAAPFVFGGNLPSNTWAVSVRLKTDSDKAWCVDSFGASRQVNAVGVNNDAFVITGAFGSESVSCKP